MSSQIIEQAGVISAAIRTLREKLGQTQAGMARLLGASLRSYDRWEAAHTIPRGDILVKMIALCPDDDTRSLFQVPGGSQPSAKRPPTKRVGPRGGSPRDRLRTHFRNSCVEAIEIIYETAVLGSKAADEKLRSFADELNRNALSSAESIVKLEASPPGDNG